MRCKPFDDRGFSHARLTNEHGVVLGAALEHLNGAADFVVPANDRVELTRLRPLREVDGEALKGLPPLLCVGAREVFPAPQRIDGALEVFRRGPRDAQRRGRFRPRVPGPRGPRARS